MRDHQRENIIKDFTQKRSGYYVRNYENANAANYLRRLRRSAIVDQIPKAGSHGRVLDIGCGPAILYPALLAECEKYYAVDLVPANLDELKAKNGNPKIVCVCSDLDTFDWQTNYFDVIICSGAIEYTTRAESNLFKLIDYLKHAGVLICSFPNVASPYRLWSEFVYTPVTIAAKRLIGKRVYSYKRRLFSSEKTTALLSHKNVDYHVTYLGYKFIPQPMDKLLASIDHIISESLQKHPYPQLEKFCSEFLLTIIRH